MQQDTDILKIELNPDKLSGRQEHQRKYPGCVLNWRMRLKNLESFASVCIWKPTRPPSGSVRAVVHI
jgi:hypothetical protein